MGMSGKSNGITTLTSIWMTFSNKDILVVKYLQFTGALAAFFGCPLGGSLFALEVNSRFGVEYFEHVSYRVKCTGETPPSKMYALMTCQTLVYLS